LLLFVPQLQLRPEGARGTAAAVQKKHTRRQMQATTAPAASAAVASLLERQQEKNILFSPKLAGLLLAVYSAVCP